LGQDFIIRRCGPPPCNSRRHCRDVGDRANRETSLLRGGVRRGSGAGALLEPGCEASDQVCWRIRYRRDPSAGSLMFASLKHRADNPLKNKRIVVRRECRDTGRACQQEYCIPGQPSPRALSQRLTGFRASPSGLPPAQRSWSVKPLEAFDQRGGEAIGLRRRPLVVDSRGLPLSDVGGKGDDGREEASAHFRHCPPITLAGCKYGMGCHILHL
jgi:hypothetical protein